MIVALALAGAAALAPAGSHPGACTTAEPEGVSVVIDYQRLGGTTEVLCALDLPRGATGREALAAVGVPVQGTSHEGDSFVCRLRGRPGASEALARASDPEYRETCEATPPSDSYWSYWQAADGGSWGYASKGPSSQRVKPGGFEGWSFNLGGASAPAPRVSPVKAPAPAPPPAPTPAPAEGGSSSGEPGRDSSDGPAPDGPDGGADGPGAAASTDPPATATETLDASPTSLSPTWGATGTDGTPPGTGGTEDSARGASGRRTGAPGWALLGAVALIAGAAALWRRPARPGSG